MTVLLGHFAALEKSLLAQAGVQAGAGHSLHKGTPREHFIREFLQNHLSERVAIGTGEIVCATSLPGERRNQHDIVLYKHDYPKLALGGGINSFLIESVVSTVEVKSTLTKEELKKAFVAAQRLKRLPRNVIRAFSAGYQPPATLSFVVAYDGPASMHTVYGWLPEIHSELGIEQTSLGATRAQRITVAAPAIDGVFVLGRGFLTFDNTPFSFVTEESCTANRLASWAFGDMPSGNLFALFLTLTVAASGLAGAWLNAGPYAAGLSAEDVGLGAG